MFVKEKIKKTLDKFLFSLYHASEELLGVVSSSFLIGKGLGQCKFSDFFEFRIFLGETNYLRRTG